MKIGGAELNAARSAAARGDMGELQRLKESAASRLGEVKKVSPLESFLQVAVGASPTGLFANLFGGKGTSDKLAHAAAAGTVEGNKDTNIQTQEAYLDEIRKLQSALDANTKATLARGGSGGGGPAPEASRVAPIVSPSRG